MAQEITKGAIGRNAFWSVMHQSVSQLLVLGIFLVTARFVPKEDFGVMAIALLVIEAFRQIFAESIATTLYARKDPSQKDYNAAFILMIGGGVLAALTVYLTAGLLADLLDDSAITPALHWVSPVLLAVCLSRIHETWLGKNYKFKLLAIRSIVSILIGGAVGIYLAMKGHGIAALIAQQLVTAAIGTIWLWLTTPWRPGFKTDKTSMMSILDYTRHVSLGAVSRFINSQSDVFFSSYYLGATSTGVYNAAKRISTAIGMMLGSGLSLVAMPLMASVSDDTERSARGFLKCVTFSTIITAPLYAGLAVMSPDLIQILLGEKWADVAPIVSILALSGFIAALAQYNVNVLLVHGKPHWQTVLTVISSAINIVLFIITARYGLVVLAASFALKTLAFHPVVTIVTLRLLKLSVTAYLSCLWPSLLSAGVMAAAVLGLRNHFAQLGAMESLVLLVPIGGVVYAAMMFALDRKSVMDLLHIGRQMVKKQ